MHLGTHTVAARTREAMEERVLPFEEPGRTGEQEERGSVFFKGGRTVLSRRRGTYTILAAVLVAAAVLLAAPAWSKEASFRKGSERTGEATTGKGSSRDKSGSDSFKS